jgi:hypothetical protein
LSCLAFILSAAISGPAKAEKPGGLQTMIYEVYAGGIHAVQARLDLDFRAKDRYDMKMSAKTRGFLASLAPWEGVFESHGWIVGDGDFRPEMHKSADIWRGEAEVKEYKYTRDRKFLGLNITEHEKKPNRRKVPDELTQGTTDAFTAALVAMQAVSDGHECSGTSEVFDGKRRFRLVFNPEGTEQLQASKYNIYEGIASACTVEVVPVAGEWHDKPRGWMSIQEQGRARGTMPTIWLADMGKNGPAVPVKIRVKTDYGTLFMHLAEYNNGTDLIVAEKRVLD